MMHSWNEIGKVWISWLGDRFWYTFINNASWRNTTSKIDRKSINSPRMASSVSRVPFDTVATYNDKRNNNSVSVNIALHRITSRRAVSKMASAASMTSAAASTSSTMAASTMRPPSLTSPMSMASSISCSSSLFAASQNQVRSRLFANKISEAFTWKRHMELKGLTCYKGTCIAGVSIIWLIRFHIVIPWMQFLSN